MTRYNVSSTEFVSTWVSSDSLDEVCQRLGMAKVEANAFAATLRKIGVKLPSMKRGRKPTPVDLAEVAKLNDLITDSKQAA